MKQQVAGHLQKHVPKEEDASGESEDSGAKAQLFVHVEGSEADIDPVQVVKEHHGKK